MRVTTTFGLRMAMEGHEKGRVETRRVRVCSKAFGSGQWALRRMAVFLLCTGLSGAGLAVAGCSRHPTKAAADAARPTPSGQPVPRYVALKFGKVNARGGPGDDYKLLWVYRVKGLPLQVVAETEDWRRVCDPDGQVSWVHRRTVAERRTVMRTDPGPVMLRRDPSDASAASATLLGRSLADLKSCRNGWCKIAAGHGGGWIRAGEVWGLDDKPLCRSD